MCMPSSRHANPAFQLPRLFPDSRYIGYRPLDPRCPYYRLTTPKEQLMENAEKGEKGEKGSPPLQIDPKWYVHRSKLIADC